VSDSQNGLTDEEPIYFQRTNDQMLKSDPYIHRAESGEMERQEFTMGHGVWKNEV